MSSILTIHELQFQIGLPSSTPSSENVLPFYFIGFLKTVESCHKYIAKPIRLLADKSISPSVANVLNIGVTNLQVDPKTENTHMTQFKVELYKKGERRPYETFMADLGARGTHPKHTSTQECFGGKLDKAYRVKVFYASNGAIAAYKTYDRKNGHGRLSWVKH